MITVFAVMGMVVVVGVEDVEEDEDEESVLFSKLLVESAATFLLF